MSELKPCPFCGGPVKLEEANSTRDSLYGERRWWGVVCRNTINRGGSCAIQQRPSASKEAAIERWNRRAQSSTSNQAEVVTTVQAGQVLSDEKLWEMWVESPSDVLRFARAIEAAVLAKRVPQWLPIETAPKDFVSEFDGWNGERVPNVSWAHPEYSPKGHVDWCVSEYETGHGWVNVAVKNLTHWMPLPPPPGIVGEKGGA